MKWHQNHLTTLRMGLSPFCKFKGKVGKCSVCKHRFFCLTHRGLTNIKFERDKNKPFLKMFAKRK